MEKRYQIFISSTFKDLTEERQASQKVILEMGHMPAGMELFPASDDSAWQLIRDVIDSSDYYVLIIGGRYGSLDSEGLSFTEKEYDYAYNAKIPTLAFLIKDPTNLPRNRTESDPECWEKLSVFRQRIESHHTCTYWSSSEELASRVILGLQSAFRRFPRVGWTRSNLMTSSEATQEIVELRKIIDQKNAELTKYLSLSDSGVEHLAQGEDIIEIGFQASFTDHTKSWGAAGRIQRIPGDLVVSWIELFAAIAPACVEPLAESDTKLELIRFLREKYRRIVLEKDPTADMSHFSITESEFQKVKIQLMALGLIESCQVKIKKGDSEYAVRGCVLAIKGHKYLMNNLAIKRSSIPVTTPNP